MQTRPLYTGFRRLSTGLAVTRAADLTHIFDPDIHLVWWTRPANPAITGYLEQVAHRLAPPPREVATVDRDPALAGLPDAPGRSALLEDIGFLSRLYADLLGCTRIGRRLEITDSAMCPRFHVDRVGIRLLCTYRGPGTEWLGVKKRLEASSPGAIATQSSEHRTLSPSAFSLPVFALALLKGELWQGDRGNGVIHRSPSVPTQQAPRVLLALDAVWEN